MRYVGAVVGGFVIAWVVSIAFGVLAVLLRAPTEQMQQWQGWSLLGIWIAYVFRAVRQRYTARRSFGLAALWVGVASLAAPIAVPFVASATLAQSTSDALAAGAATGIATVIAGFFGFFFGAIFLVLALVLLRGDRGATKPCPRCAERVLLAATVCRYCRHRFNAPATATTES